MSLITCKNLGKSYPGQQALQGVELSVEQGEYLALEGVSGSGKSTLLALLGLLDVPSSGDVWIQGQPTAALSFSQRCHLRNRHFGFVFQTFNLLGDLSVLDNVMLPLQYSDLPRGSYRERALQRLEQVGLAERAGDRPGQLSGGQQQRVAIARALVTEPDVLLADEPTGNLDSGNAEQVMALFAQLHDQGATIIMATHNPAFASRCQRRIHLRDGRIQEG